MFDSCMILRGFRILTFRRDLNTTILFKYGSGSDLGTRIRNPGMYYKFQHSPIYEGVIVHVYPCIKFRNSFKM